MNTAVNGIGAGTASSAGISGASVSIGNANQTQKTTRTGPNQNRVTVKKQLNYNPKEISSQIMRASKVRNASAVLARAKNKVGMLQKCLGTGQYNDNEVRAAIAHAKGLVKCAQMRVQNLREEERVQKRNERAHATRERQQQGEVRRRVSNKEKHMAEKAAIGEIQQAVREKSEQQELMQKRRRHRRNEHEKINEADLQYLRDRMRHPGSVEGATGMAQGMSYGVPLTGTQPGAEAAAEAAVTAEMAGTEASAGMDVTAGSGTVAVSGAVVDVCI